MVDMVYSIFYFQLDSMDELEAFDIDEPWQFEVGEILYDKFIKRS